MLLYHWTDFKNFKKILIDGKLKPSSKTKIRKQNPFKFFLPYVFFNAIPKKQLVNFTKPYGVGIVFKKDILLGKVFYTNKNHSAGNTKTSKKYKINDKKDLWNVLYSLYSHSLRIIKKIKFVTKNTTYGLAAFQEVFTRVEPSLNDAVYIIMNPADLKIIKKIKKLYPNIEIITS